MSLWFWLHTLCESVAVSVRLSEPVGSLPSACVTVRLSVWVLWLLHVCVCELSLSVTVLPFGSKCEAVSMSV